MGCTIVTTERQLTAVVKAEAAFARMPEAQRCSRASLAAILPSIDVGAVGPNCTRWTPPVGGRLPMEIGLVVARSFHAKGEVVSSDLPAGRAAHLSMKGSFGHCLSLKSGPQG